MTEENGKLDEDLNEYMLINAIAKRAKQLDRGATPLIKDDMKFNKSIDIAREEIKRGKIKIENLREDKENDSEEE